LKTEKNENEVITNNIGATGSEKLMVFEKCKINFHIYIYQSCLHWHHSCPAYLCFSQNGGLFW